MKKYIVTALFIAMFPIAAMDPSKSLEQISESKRWEDCSDQHFSPICLDEKAFTTKVLYKLEELEKMDKKVLAAHIVGGALGVAIDVAIYKALGGSLDSPFELAKSTRNSIAALYQ